MKNLNNLDVGCTKCDDHPRRREGEDVLKVEVEVE